VAALDGISAGSRCPADMTGRPGHAAQGAASWLGGPRSRSA